MSNKSEKRRIEQAFPFIQLYLTIKGGAITNSDNVRNKIESIIDKILDENDVSKRKKLDNRIAKLNRDCGITDLIKRKISGQKFILTIYYLTLKIIEETKTKLDQELENTFEYFLDIEYKSNKSDEEVLKLRKSAKKQGEKLFIRLQELGYYS